MIDVKNWLMWYSIDVIYDWCEIWSMCYMIDGYRIDGYMIDVIYDCCDKWLLCDIWLMWYMIDVIYDWCVIW